MDNLTDNDGQRPTMTDNVRQDQVSFNKDDKLTTKEVTELFIGADLPRSQRSIERYCKQGKLDSFLDPDEGIYYISKDSVDILIDQIKEINARHSDTTTTDSVGQVPPLTEKPEEKDNDQLKENEKQIFELTVMNKAKDVVIDKQDKMISQFSEKIETLAKRTGILETELRQLKEPDKNRKDYIKSEQAIEIEHEEIPEEQTENFGKDQFGA